MEIFIVRVPRADLTQVLGLLCSTVRNLLLASIGILRVRVPASPEFVVALVIMQVAPPEIELSVPLLPPMTRVLVLPWESALRALAMINATLVSPLFPGLFP